MKYSPMFAPLWQTATFFCLSNEMPPLFEIKNKGLLIYLLRKSWTEDAVHLERAGHYAV